MKRVGACIALVFGGTVCAQAGPVTPLTASSDTRIAAPWQVIALARIPRHTQYSVVMLDGQRVVMADANGSYANVVHALNAGIHASPILRWRWRVDRFPAGSNLAVKSGDDVAAKVCALFDLPLSRLAIFDRLKIQLGRRLFKLDLPAATLCYVWDRTLAPGTWLPNVYTDRVRMLVLRSAVAGDQGHWFEERRDLRADFVRAFGAEADGGLPNISAVAFATDADNTGDAALAYFGDIALERQ